MINKGPELRLECLKIAFSACRDFPEALERAKQLEEYVLSEQPKFDEEAEHLKKGNKASKKKGDNLDSLI